MVIGGYLLNIGDPIKYTRCGSTSHAKPKRREGIIIHLTNKIITVNLGKYRESISITDLACGVASIDGMKEIVITTSEVNELYKPAEELQREAPDYSEYQKIERGEESMKIKLEAPKDLSSSWEKANYVVGTLAKNYGVAWGTARGWLRNAGLMPGTKTEAEITAALTEKPQTQPEPVQVDRHEPAQALGESANKIIPEFEEDLKQHTDWVKVNPKLIYDDFTSEDDEPIPYIVEPSFDLAPIKIQLIATALAEYKDEQLPADITLELVKAIGSIELLRVS